MISTTSIPDNCFEFRGLSTDTKPLKVANGCVFIEMDTVKVFMFDGEHQEWIELTSKDGE
jgi:hypothetical protein